MEGALQYKGVHMFSLAFQNNVCECNLVTLHKKMILDKSFYLSLLYCYLL